MPVNLGRYIRTVPNWPNPGVHFKDITPLLQDRRAFRAAIQKLARPFKHKKIDFVAGIDARGFVLAAPLAYVLGAGLIIMRKKGKLPSKTIGENYTLEYGTHRLEVHKDALTRGQRVLIVDDVLATGGTMGAAIKLIKRLGGTIVSLAFLAELTALPGVKRLQRFKRHTLLVY